MAIFLAMLALAACVSAPVPTASGPTAKIGHTALVDGVEVRPLRLIEDSRCPALVHCIWAGRLRIEAVIQFNGDSEELHSEMTLGESISLPQGKLTLSAAVPVPVAGRALPASAYRFTFALSP